MKRRDFLKSGAAGLTAAGLSPWLAGCSGPAGRHDFPAAESIASLGGQLDPVSCEMLYLASLAPSGHNTQPWQVRIERPDRWFLELAPQRQLSVVDPARREALLSAGAFLENLADAGRHHGRPVELAGADSENGLAILFVGSSEARPANLEAIANRRTLRGPFAPRRIRRADVAEFLRDTRDTEYFPPDSRESGWLDEATVEALAAQCRRLPVMEELSEWIHWSDDAARQHRKGLTPAAMGINGFTGWWARHFLESEDVLSQSFAEATIRQTKEEIGSSGGWIVVSGAGDSSEGLLSAGRQCERLWLKARALDVAIHPMSQALEETPWRTEVGTRLGLDAPPQFLLRVGYAAQYPPPVSLRLPLSAFVTISSGSDV
jgi:hypothetical protein